MFTCLFFVFVTLVYRAESRTSSNKGGSDDAFSGKIRVDGTLWIRTHRAVQFNVIKIMLNSGQGSDVEKGFYHDLERLQERLTVQDLVRLIPGRGLEITYLHVVHIIRLML